MRHTTSWIMLFALGTTLAVSMAGGDGGGQEPEFTSDFRIEHCKLVPNGGNAFFSLEPGTFRRYEAVDDEGGFVELEIEGLRQTRRITFDAGGRRIRAKTRVIREREWVDGELVEESRNYFARCAKTGNVYYLGEDVDFFEDGVIVGHDGAWRAGRDDAVPGLIMPGLFLLGARYFQEMAPEVALDRAEHVAMGLEVETPAGVFEGCVMIVETTPLEPGSESVKIYAPGVGLIVDGDLELVEYGSADDDDGD